MLRTPKSWLNYFVQPFSNFFAHFKTFSMISRLKTTKHDWKWTKKHVFSINAYSSKLVDMEKLVDSLRGISFRLIFLIFSTTKPDRIMATTNFTNSWTWGLVFSLLIASRNRILIRSLLFEWLFLGMLFVLQCLILLYRIFFRYFEANFWNYCDIHSFEIYFLFQ